MGKGVRSMEHVCRAVVVALTLQVILEVKQLLAKIVDFMTEKVVKSMVLVCQVVVVHNLVDTDKIKTSLLNR
jgi:hypothetical protein